MKMSEMLFLQADMLVEMGASRDDVAAVRWKAEIWGDFEEDYLDGAADNEMEVQ